MRSTLSNKYLLANLKILEQHGFPAKNALSALQLTADDLAVPNGRIPLERFQNCLSAAAEYISNPQIGLHLGLRFRVGSFGHTGSIYGFCEDLKEVMEMNNLYQKLAIDAGGVSYMRSPDGEHHMCFTPHVAEWSQQNYILDIIMASYVTTYRWLSWGSGEDVLSVSLPYINRSEREAYEDILQSRVHVDRSHICVEFSEIAISEKLTTRDPERLARARMALDHMIGQQTALTDFEKGVDAAIRGAIGSGKLSAYIVADRMGLSASVFRARLAETGEGIRPRVENVRKTLFAEKIKLGLPLSQIALDLAYNDQAAMNRAVRRWYGMTPTQWLAENQVTQPED